MSPFCYVKMDSQVDRLAAIPAPMRMSWLQVQPKAEGGGVNLPPAAVANDMGNRFNVLPVSRVADHPDFAVVKASERAVEYLDVSGEVLADDGKLARGERNDEIVRPDAGQRGQVRYPENGRDLIKKPRIGEDGG